MAHAGRALSEAHDVLHDSIINPRDTLYGAAANGTTDDYAALQLALDDAATSGAKLYLPAGTYRYTQTPTVSGGTVRIEGAGIGSTILAPDGCLGLAITGTTGSRCDNSCISDLEIDGTNGITGGLSWGWASRMVVERVYVHDCAGHGLYGDGTGTYNFMKFKEVISTANTGDGINLTSTSSKSNNCELYGVFCSTNQGYGLNTLGTSTRVYGGEFANNWLYGMRISGLSVALFDSLVENNWHSLGTYATGTDYIAGDRVHPTDTTTYPYTFMCTTGGTSGGTEPTWSSAATRGETIADNTVTWTNVGTNTEGNSGGAGIDDTGASRLWYFRDNTVNQQILGMGNSFQMTTRSDGPGGALEVRSGRANLGLLDGFYMVGAAGQALLIATGDSTNISLGLQAKGTGTVKVATASTQKVGFYGSTGSARQVLATGAGASADDIITALQALGMVSQS